MENRCHISSHAELVGLPKGNFLWRRDIGMIVLGGEFENHPKRSFIQNELNTHYYACGCDESALGFLIGVIVACLLLADVWFNSATPSFSSLLVCILLVAAGGLIGKAYGKYTANRKLLSTIVAIVPLKI